MFTLGGLNQEVSHQPYILLNSIQFYTHPNEYFVLDASHRYETFQDTICDLNSTRNADVKTFQILNTSKIKSKINSLCYL